MIFLKKYIQESIDEFNRVTWPTRKQTIKLTGIVIGFVILAAIFIGGIDIIFSLAV